MLPLAHSASHNVWNIFHTQAPTPPQPTLWVRVSTSFGSFSTLMGTAEGIQYTSRFIAAVANVASPIFDTVRIMTPFRAADSFVAAVRIVLDGQYFLGTKLTNDLLRETWEGALAVAHHVAFTVSDIATTLDWASTYQLLDYASISVSIGSLAVFGVTAATVGQFIVVTALIGYIVWGVECALKAYRGDDSRLNNVCLARCVSELFNKSFVLGAGALIAAPASFFVTSTAAAIAAGLAVMSVYEAQNAKRK
ncbi:MAG: hypothetical protein Q8K75_05980 [Chlamydiales bacterium]|nr:hypothetical protein [Chlamydiales bacterium]